MQLFLFITVVIMIVFGSIHFQNPDLTVSMKFVTWIFEAKPIALILAIPFAIGILFGAFIFVPPWMKKAGLARHQKKRIHAYLSPTHGFLMQSFTQFSTI